MKDKIRMILFILILGSFLTSVLLLVDSYASPIIKRNNILKIKKSILTALEIPYNNKNITDVFSNNIKVVKKKNKTFYISGNGDVSFKMSGPGVWGPIESAIALKPDLKTIKSITIIHQEETPGLGSRITGKKFLNEFKNKVIIPEIRIVRAGQAKGNNEVDAITGATLSSKAFEALINNQIKLYLPLIKGGKK